MERVIAEETMRNLLVIATAFLSIMVSWIPQARGALISYNLQAVEKTDPGTSGTFMGKGSIIISASAENNSITIMDFAFDVSVLGSIPNDTNINNNLYKDAVHKFSYTESDIVSLRELQLAGSSLSGEMVFADKPSDLPAVMLQNLILDFSAGMASGFCFDTIGGAQCIRGGGTSTSLEANLRVAVVSGPPALPLFVIGLISLSVFRLRHLRTSRAGR